MRQISSLKVSKHRENEKVPYNELTFLLFDGYVISGKPSPYRTNINPQNHHNNCSIPPPPPPPPQSFIHLIEALFWWRRHFNLRFVDLYKHAWLSVPSRRTHKTRAPGGHLVEEKCAGTARKRETRGERTREFMDERWENTQQAVFLHDENGSILAWL